MNYKYIKFEDIGIVIFPCSVNHDRMADMIKKTPISAGFVSFNVDHVRQSVRVNCHGESISLKLKAAPEDAALCKLYGSL